MVSYKLLYFARRSRAEPIRLLFAQAAVQYEDQIVKDDEWPQMKASGKLPFAQLPVLEVDGELLAQSNAIIRFVANRYGLSPTGEFDIARADQILDGIYDVFLKLDEYYEKEHQKQAKLKKEFFDIYVPTQLGYFEKLLKSNEGGKRYFVGDKLTYADIVFFNFWNSNFVGGKPVVPDELKAFPLLVEHYKRVLNEPKILHWINTRPNFEW